MIRRLLQTLFPNGTMRLSLLLSLIFALLVMPLFFRAAAATAAPRDSIVEQLRALENTWPGRAVRVSVLGSEGAPLRIGEELTYQFESNKAGYLTAIHVDTHGSTTLLYPRSNPEDGRLEMGQPLRLPQASDGFTLQVQPPVGRDLVYAIVTSTPIRRRELGISSGDVVVSMEPHQAPAFLRQLRSILDSRLPGEVAIAHVVQQIEGRGEVQYRSEDIVGFFGERTRSIRPPKLDLQIHFASDSAELDAEARRNIDEFARALEDPKLANIRFKVAGHTDDRGSEAHNVGLSRRRAETVRRYLIESGGISAGRLEVEAHGENYPLMSEDSTYARELNRRVEFMPAR
jgi:outer membrane protein OmpA-like peptidoglycan-associated protein